MDLNTLTWLLQQLKGELNKAEEEQVGGLAYAMQGLMEEEKQQDGKGQQQKGEKAEPSGEIGETEAEWKVNEALTEASRKEWRGMLDGLKGAFVFTLQQLGKYEGREVAFLIQLTTAEPEEEEMEPRSSGCSQPEMPGAVGGGTDPSF